MIDYLTTTANYEICFGGRLPIEVPSFKSLWLPFDNVTWAFISGAAVTAAMVLFQIQRSWSLLQGQEKDSSPKEAAEGES